MKKIREEDLYRPVKEYISKMGFEVKGEVGHVDVMGVKDDIVLAVEMKKSLNLDVVVQGALRQRIADMVYIAVPKNSRELFSKRWKNIFYLLRRLELGLLVVTFKGNSSLVQEIVKPEPFSREKSRSLSNNKRLVLMEEFNSRSGDYNIGGSTGKKLLTAYREKAIQIGAILKVHNILTLKDLREFGCDCKKTGEILRDNHYGWFQRVKRGEYKLTDKGFEEIENYKELVEFYGKSSK